MTTLPSVGDRFRLRHDVDRFPDFIAPMGWTGRIVYADEHQIGLQMNAKLEGAEEWDNCVIWDHNMEQYDAFWLDCERMGEEG